VLTRASAPLWLLLACVGTVAISCGYKLDSPNLAMPPAPAAREAVTLDPAGQWPAWRGGLLHGVAAEETAEQEDQIAPITWSADQGIRWKARLAGRGNSSPIVWSDAVYLTVELENAADRQLALVCFDRADGSLRWSRTVATAAGATHRNNGHASATLATDGDGLYAWFGSAGLFCLDRSDGSVRWRRELGSLPHQWGHAASPVLYGDLVIQLCDSEGESFLIALDKQTGQTRWRRPRDSRGCWSTPILVRGEAPGGPRVELIVNGTGGSPGQVIAYDPDSGRVLWRVAGTTDIPCPTAIAGEGLVVSTSGGGGPIMAIRPGKVKDRVLWRKATGGPYVPTGVIHKQRLFIVEDVGMMSCYDLATGERLWEKRLRGPFRASLVAAGDHIYAVNERGAAYVIKATERFELVAKNVLREEVAATPAIAGGELFIRSDSHLWCIAGAEEKDPSIAAAQPPNKSPSDQEARKDDDRPGSRP